MLAPIDFIKEKYIEPNKITQDKLCEVLQIGKKTISELYQKKRGFTIHTAKKFAKFFDLKPEFILLKQMEYDLSLDKEDYDFIKPYNELLQEDKKLSISKWILSIINNSISDKRLHYTLDDLYTIFSIPSINIKYQYAISLIFQEVNYEDVIKYCEFYNIDKSNLKILYEYYKNKYNTKEIPQYEWLLK
ncbi:helix-turn-helix transcriptional regulator [Aliarcobacter lanthieri]|uniref:helix-turn-helix transcriptional regulator n=1 Tax=Aliarcobacter lanthieri TaxID=1355374 RepID=UPI000479F474|nr:helix-turn-helix domain-containing protein [Aliarcobacter lanthieri]